MARTIPPLGEALVKEIEAAWAQPQEDWARKRLLVVRLIAQHQMTTDQIAQVAGVSRKSVFRSLGGGGRRNSVRGRKAFACARFRGRTSGPRRS